MRCLKCISLHLSMTCVLWLYIYYLKIYYSDFVSYDFLEELSHALNNPDTEKSEFRIQLKVKHQFKWDVFYFLPFCVLLIYTFSSRCVFVFTNIWLIDKFSGLITKKRHVLFSTGYNVLTWKTCLLQEVLGLDPDTVVYQLYNPGQMSEPVSWSDRWGLIIGTKVGLRYE